MTHALLREQGYMVAKTEHWNHHAKKRQDLFGIIDTLAIHPEPDRAMLAIQTTDAEHRSEHRKKLLTHEVPPVWTLHAKLELWSWGKKGAEGKRKLWCVTRERFHMHNGKIVSFEVT